MEVSQRFIATKSLPIKERKGKGKSHLEKGKKVVLWHFLLTLALGGKESLAWQWFWSSCNHILILSSLPQTSKQNLFVNIVYVCSNLSEIPEGLMQCACLCFAHAGTWAGKVASSAPKSCKVTIDLQMPGAWNYRRKRTADYLWPGGQAGVRLFVGN